VVGDARLDTLGVGISGARRSIALVALGGALVGLDDLGGVGTGVAQACGLAVDIACVASHGALHSRRETRRHWGGRDSRAGDVGSNGAGGEEENGRVLHGVVGLRVA
jgi:hypothetical protein